MQTVIKSCWDCKSTASSGMECLPKANEGFCQTANYFKRVNKLQIRTQKKKLVRIYQRWVWFLCLGCFHKLGFCLCSCSNGVLNVWINVICMWSTREGYRWKKINRYIRVSFRLLPITTPCSWTSTARSLKISFTSPICCWISWIPCSRSSITASLKAISLPNSRTSCLNEA